MRHAGQSSQPRFGITPVGALPRSRRSAQTRGMGAHQPGTQPAPTVWHCFRCSDAHAVIDWLVEALGFVETVSARDPEGNVWSVGQYRGEPLPAGTS